MGNVRVLRAERLRSTYLDNSQTLWRMGGLYSSMVLVGLTHSTLSLLFGWVQERRVVGGRSPPRYDYSADFSSSWTICSSWKPGVVAWRWIALRAMPNCLASRRPARRRFMIRFTAFSSRGLLVEGL